MVYKSYYKSVCRGYPVKYPSVPSSGEEISFPQESLGKIGDFPAWVDIYIPFALCLTSSRTWRRG